MNSSMKAPKNTPINSRRRVRVAISIIALALIAYSAVCAAFYLWQEGLVFEPERGLVRTPRAVGLAYEDLTLTTADGVALAAWFVPGGPQGRTILLLHGNGGNISHYLRTLLVLHQLGHAVLAVDYRGFGRSAGVPSESGTYRDAEAAFDYLVRQRRLAPANIVVYGRSLGGAVATWLAAHRRPGGLILESTFTRLVDLGALRYPWLPVALLSRFEYDSAVQIRRVRCPVLVAHGRADGTVPFRFGRALAAQASPAADFVALPGGHNDAFLRGGPTYYQHLDAFIRRVGTP